jgi:hypothetical protein
MRSMTFLAPVLLTACAAAQPPVHGETAGHACRPSGGEFIGELGTSESGAAILRSSNAAVLRWAPPGAMLTMDYRSDRVTVYLGPDGRISKISCG